MNEESIRNNFANVVNNFDFSKVYQVMNILDWTWYDSGETPSQSKLIEGATQVFESALNKFSKNKNNEEIRMGSGGFYVSIFSITEIVVLEFVVEEQHSCDL
jgi:hypothetical protein